MFLLKAISSYKSITFAHDCNCPADEPVLHDYLRAWVGLYLSAGITRPQLPSNENTLCVFLVHVKYGVYYFVAMSLISGNGVFAIGMRSNNPAFGFAMCPPEKGVCSSRYCKTGKFCDMKIS